MAFIQRFAVLLTGVWLGAGVLADIAVTQNFTTVDRFLATPGSPDAAAEINGIGHARARDFLRRNAGEENNWLFSDWERTQFAVGAALILCLICGRSGIMPIAVASSMFVIAAVQDLALSPRIAELGRLVPSLPPADPVVARFWKMHGIYSGIEILKLVLGLFLAGWLVRTPSASPVEPSPAATIIAHG